MRVLVIGGTGFIGLQVSRQLTALGHQVVVFRRSRTTTTLPSSIRIVTNESSQLPIASYPPELLQTQFDVVIHMIAMTEVDAVALVRDFSNAGRLVVASSGDVYRAYGRLIRSETGPVEPVPLNEDSPLRDVLYPYRAKAEEAWQRSYDKILVERVLVPAGGTILRLPKVYGPGPLPKSNSDFATVYSFAHVPHWHWAHGYVDNVASAIVLAAFHPAGAGKIYNVGEEHTPTMGERLKQLPPPMKPHPKSSDFFFDQNIVYDTSRIRQELGYQEVVPYEEGIKRTIATW